jgi:hypothetical protein
MTTPAHRAGFVFGLALGAFCIAAGFSTPAPAPLPPAHTLTHFPGP